MWVQVGWDLESTKIVGHFSKLRSFERWDPCYPQVPQRRVAEISPLSRPWHPWHQLRAPGGSSVRGKLGDPRNNGDFLGGTMTVPIVFWLIDVLLCTVQCHLEFLDLGSISTLNLENVVFFGIRIPVGQEVWIFSLMLWKKNNDNGMFFCGTTKGLV